MIIGKGRILLILLISLFFLVNTQSQINYEVTNSGNWEVSTTWTGGIIAPINSSATNVKVTIQGADYTVFLNNNINITDGFSYEFMLNTGTLDIYGNVMVTGACYITTQGSANLRIHGNLVIGPGSNVICSKPIEVFGNVSISGSSTVNINGGPFIVHGDYNSDATTNITPDAVFAVEGSFTGYLVSYNGDGNLFVNGSTNLLPGSAPNAYYCGVDYSGPNTHSDCAVGDFVDLSIRYPDIYNVYFGSDLQTFYVTGKNICSSSGVGYVYLSGSTVGVNYQLRKDGVDVGSPIAGTGTNLTYTVVSAGNYTIRAIKGPITRDMNGVAVIGVYNTPVVINTVPGEACAGNTVTLTANYTVGNVYWYASSSGGSSISSGNTYITPVLTNTTTYYVEANNNGCISSPRVAVTATIYDVPSLMVINHD